MKTVLCFSDAHVAPGQDLRRFDWLGALIVDLKPDAIFNGGDIATNDSVSYWRVPEADKVSLADDVKVVKEAQRRMFAPLNRYNANQARTKHRQYKPYTFMTQGNHEYRLNRRIEDDELGLGSVVDPISIYEFDKHWDDIAPWKEYINYHGVDFTHCPPNRLGRPMTGLYRGRQIALQSGNSTIYGHSHAIDFTTVGLLGNDNEFRASLNLPCFMEQDHVEEYATGSTTGWAYGVVILYIHDEGQFTFRWISMTELETLYGN